MGYGYMDALKLVFYLKGGVSYMSAISFLRDRVEMTGKTPKNKSQRFKE